MELIFLAISCMGFTSFLFAIYYYLTLRREKTYAESLKEELRKVKEVLPRHMLPRYARQKFRKEAQQSLLEMEESIKNVVAKMNKTEFWSDPEFYYKVGVYYFVLEKYDLAIENFEKTLRLNPYHKMVYFNIGAAHLELGNWEKAIECFNKSIELDEKYAEAYYNLGWIYDEREDYKEAIECYEKSMETFYDAIYNKACALAKWGKEDEAIEELTRIIHKNNIREAVQTDRDFENLREKGKLDTLLQPKN